jgi:hypothetical protein
MNEKRFETMKESFLNHLKGIAQSYYKQEENEKIKPIGFGKEISKMDFNELIHFLLQNDFPDENYLDRFLRNAEHILNKFASLENGEIKLKEVTPSVENYALTYAVTFYFQYFILVESSKEEFSRQQKQIEKERKYFERIQEIPIVKIDYTTSKDFLPIFMNKKIFSNPKILPTKDDLLNIVKEKIGRERLTLQEEREILSGQEYVDNGFVFRDYGKYVIGFDMLTFSREFLDLTENQLQKDLNNGYLFPEDIQESIKRIRLYKLSHKIAYIVLSEVYLQKSCSIILPKETIIYNLGYTTKDKQIYDDIESALFSLRWCQYKIFGYEYKDISRIKTNRPKSKTIGNFIYNLKDTGKEYVLDVNPKFIGSISLFLEDKKGEIPKENFRGYYTYPTSILRLSKDYSTPTYLLTDALLREQGNKKYSEDKLKCICYPIRKFVQIANLNYSQASKNYRQFIEALKGVDIIEKLEPTIDQLENLKPGKAFKVELKIWIKSDIVELDKFIQEKLAQE